MKIKIISFTFLLFALGHISLAQSFNSTSLFNKSKEAVFEIITYDKGNSELSYGTGFFIDSNGVGVTNYHVLKDAFHASIRTFNKDIYSIKDILYADEDFDVVKFTIGNEGEKFKYLKMSKQPINPGDDVFVIGNPEGLEYSMSTGIIAAIREKKVNERTIKLIQTTAPISHGNSGSPLINKQGQALGIISFTYAEGQNLNFAVSINEIIKRVSDITLKLPLDKNAKSLKYDEYELELIANQGSFTPKDNIGVFMGQDKEIVKSFYRNWQVVQNTDFFYGVAHDDLGVYNYYFYEKSNICDGVDYNIPKGEETDAFIQKLFDEGYKKAKVEVRNDGTQSYYTHYFVVRISPESNDINLNYITVSWNPNYHPNFRKRDFGLK